MKQGGFGCRFGVIMEDGSLFISFDGDRKRIEVLF